MSGEVGNGVAASCAVQNLPDAAVEHLERAMDSLKWRFDEFEQLVLKRLEGLEASVTKTSSHSLGGNVDLQGWQTLCESQNNTIGILSSLVQTYSAGAAPADDGSKGTAWLAGSGRD